MFTGLWQCSCHSALLMFSRFPRRWWFSSSCLAQITLPLSTCRDRFLSILKYSQHRYPGLGCQASFKEMTFQGQLGKSEIVQSRRNFFLVLQNIRNSSSHLQPLLGWMLAVPGSTWSRWWFYADILFLALGWGNFAQFENYLNQNAFEEKTRYVLKKNSLVVHFNRKLLGSMWVCFAYIFDSNQELLYAHLREVLVFWLQFCRVTWVQCPNGWVFRWWRIFHVSLSPMSRTRRWSSSAAKAAGVKIDESKIHRCGGVVMPIMTELD